MHHFISCIVVVDAGYSLPQHYISPLCPEVPRERIFTKFGTNTPLVDVINPDKLCVNLFKVSILQGVKVSIFP